MTYTKENHEEYLRKSVVLQLSLSVIDNEEKTKAQLEEDALMASVYSERIMEV